MCLLKKSILIGAALSFLLTSSTFAVPRAIVVDDNVKVTPQAATYVPKATVVAGRKQPLGPKKMIAVSAFENKAGWSSQWNLGEGMAEQLISALAKTNQFTVLERQNLDDVLKEQDMAASGRMTSAGTGAQMGKLYKSQILIRGAITEFAETGGNDSGIAYKGFKLGGSAGQARVTVDLRIYDTTTGEVLASKTANGYAEAKKSMISYASSDFAIGTKNFKNTPLGTATRLAIEQATSFIIREMEQVEWKGKVVTVKDGFVFVNAGRKSAIKVGDKLTVYSVGEALIDPDTGMNLGAEESKSAVIEIVKAEEKFSKGRIMEGTPELIKKGDVIKFEKA